MKQDSTVPEDVKRKVVEDYDQLQKLVDGLRVVNSKIVVTIGSWDLLHIGHVRYLRKAKSHGDILIVGVDSDRAIKKYKGELRPVVPYVERCEMLTYQSCVDFVTCVDDVDEKGAWLYGLIKKVKPDIFVAVEDSYPASQLKEIRKYCKELVVLPRQAEKTSTTNMIQFAVKKHLDKMYELLDKRKK
jgi:D-beta-D-heptose 7-phosphate kinase/D-beta-D-heptose 1-phosphate adenosyltransferase